MGLSNTILQQCIIKIAKVIEIIKRLVSQAKAQTVRLSLLAQQHKRISVIIMIIFILMPIGWWAYQQSIYLKPNYTDYHLFGSEEEYQTFLQDNPLYTTTTPNQTQFTKSQKIRPDKSIVYTFKLSTMPIKPQMSKQYAENYLKYLEDSQQKALDWIKDQGENPDSLNITWQPDPVQMRQKFFNLSDKELPNKDKSSDTTKTEAEPTSTPRFPQ